MTIAGRQEASYRDPAVVWYVKDKTERDNLTTLPNGLPITPDDLGKICRVGTQKPYVYYELSGFSPLDWSQMGFSDAGSDIPEEVITDRINKALKNKHFMNQAPEDGKYLASGDQWQAYTGPSADDIDQSVSNALKNYSFMPVAPSDGQYVADGRNWQPVDSGTSAPSLALSLTTTTVYAASPEIRGTFSGVPDSIFFVLLPTDSSDDNTDLPSGTAYIAQLKVDGTFVIAAGAIGALENGTYPVSLSAQNANASISKEYTLTVDTLRMILDDVTVSTDTPRVSGQYTGSATGFHIEVKNDDNSVDLQYDGVDEGDGNWHADVTDALANGTYTVKATVDSDRGPVSTSATMTVAVGQESQLTITAVDSTVTDTRYPKISGTVSSADADITIVWKDLNGTTHNDSATNNGDGTWGYLFSTKLDNGAYSYTIKAEKDQQNPFANATVTVNVQASANAAQAVEFAGANGPYYHTQNKIEAIGVDGDMAYGIWARVDSLNSTPSGYQCQAFGPYNPYGNYAGYFGLAINKDTRNWQLSAGPKSSRQTAVLDAYGADSVWRLVIAVGDRANNTLTFYDALEGAAPVQRAQITNFTDTFVLSDTWTFGRAHALNQAQLEGALCQAFIVNQRLSSTQMQDLADGQSIDSVLGATPAHWWKLNGVADTADYGQINNQLTLEGDASGLASVAAPANVADDSSTPAPPASSTSGTALGLDGHTGLKAVVDFTLDKSKHWAFGGWFKSEKRDTSTLVSTSNHNYTYFDFDRYGSTLSDFQLKMSGSGSSKNALWFDSRGNGIGVGKEWFFVVVANDPSNGKVTARFARSGDTADTLAHRSVSFASNILVRDWAIGENIGPTQNKTPNRLVGGVQEQFVFLDQSITDAQIVDIANGDKLVSDIGKPRHYWRCSEPDDLSDSGTVASDLKVSGDAPVSADAPNTSAASGAPGGGGTGGGGTGGGGTGGGGTGGGGTEHTGKAIKEATLVSGASGNPVTVSATEQLGGGSTKTWTASVDPGKIVRMHDVDNLSFITVAHYPEGGVTVGNDLASTYHDVVLNNLHVKDPDGTTLYNDAMTIPPHVHTRPWWYKTPQLVANPRLDRLPEWDSTGQENASLAGDYDKANNTPLGHGMIHLNVADTGGRYDLGPLPGWDAAYIINPSANNARVVRGMSDAFATYPVHVRDDETLKMISIEKWPEAAIDYRFKGSDNPIKSYLNAGSTPYTVAQQASHLVGACILATMIYDTSYDREELAQSANYCCLCQNPGYRNHGKGNFFAHKQCRDKAWSLRQVACAAALVPEWSDYFNNWMGETLSWVKSHYPHDSNDCPVEWTDITRSSDRHNRDFPNYMEHFLLMSIQIAITMGHSDWQYAMDFFGRLVCQQMLDERHEVADWYHPVGYYKGYLPDWPTMCQMTAQHGNGQQWGGWMAGALSHPEDSMALQYAMHDDGEVDQNGYIGGDFRRHPLNVREGTAYLLAAIAAVSQNGQVPRIFEAAAKAKRYERIRWSQSNDAGYHLKIKTG